jgi:diguanylate cyclase (GGDEF)-like protein
MVILLWARGGAGHPRHVRLLNSGLLLIAGADASSFALEATGSRLVPGLTDVGWFLGYLLVALAAATAVRGRLASTNDAPSRNLLPVATTALATAAAGVAVVTSLTAKSEWTALTVAMGALAIVLVGRQALVDHEGGALRRRLDHELLHDPLTGLPNRVLARDRIEQALTRSRRNTNAVGVMLLDLDGHGRVTDSLGRDTGDRFLLAVASRLRRELRGADTIARLGNNEFGIVIESGPRHGVLTVAQRILDSLGNAFDIGGVTTSTKASIGVVLADADDGATAETLLHRAQVAVHYATGSNGSSISIFTSAMEDAAVQRMQLEVELRQALDEGQLTLAFQPIVSLATEEVVGVEALARWSTPDRGSVPPSVFIPVAEEAGLIGRLGRWVISEGLAHISGWRDVTSSTVTLGVNVSTLQLNDDSFADEVEQALRLAGVPGERLVVEVTESVAMGDVAASIEQLTKLKKLGVRVALDDFGTGHSSLAHLRTLPVDILKIDRCFVAGVAINPADRATVKAICTLAADSGMAVVAEGVETARQAATLQELGCELAQGYYFGRPVPPAEMLTYQTNSRFLAGFRLHSVPDPSLDGATLDRESLSG